MWDHRPVSVCPERHLLPFRIGCGNCLLCIDTDSRYLVKSNLKEGIAAKISASCDCIGVRISLKEINQNQEQKQSDSDPIKIFRIADRMTGFLRRSSS